MNILKKRIIVIRFFVESYDIFTQLQLKCIIWFMKCSNIHRKVME